MKFRSDGIRDLRSRGLRALSGEARDGILDFRKTPRSGWDLRPLHSSLLVALTMKVADRINELFLLCGGPGGYVEMRSAVKLLWPTLTNAVSLVDLAGVFA
eukprot:gene13455-16449_t